MGAAGVGAAGVGAAGVGAAESAHSKPLKMFRHTYE